MGLILEGEPAQKSIKEKASAAIFLPTGTVLKLGKKDKTVQTADDDED